MPAIEQWTGAENLPTLEKVEQILTKALPELNIKGKAREYLEECGGGLRTTCETIATLMSQGEREGIRLRAAETALKIHGALEESGGDENNITFIFKGDDVRLMNILNPQRAA